MIDTSLRLRQLHYPAKSKESGIVGLNYARPCFKKSTDILLRMNVVDFKLAIHSGTASEGRGVLEVLEVKAQGRRAVLGVEHRNGHATCTASVIEWRIQAL